jgi:hypothetical protein
MSTLSFSSDKRKYFSSFFLFLGDFKKEFYKVERIDTLVVDSGAKWMEAEHVYR